MEWEKAKNIIAIFLVILNLMLGGLIQVRDRKYVMSGEEERVIYSVLAKNNINLYSTINRNYAPMRMMTFKYYDFDYDTIIGLFFDNPNVSQRSIEGRLEFHNEEEYLYVNAALFNYENYGDGESIEFTFESAEELCRGFINKMGDLGKGFVLDLQPYYSHDRIVIEYRQEYKGYKIYNNYIKFYISETGIRSIEYSYSEPLGFAEAAREICAPDEALFSFMRWAERYRQSAIVIDKMDVVYCWIEGMELEYTAAPCYRIYFFSDDSTERQSILIDAYLNEAVRSLG